jgi:hypothetical protein
MASAMLSKKDEQVKYSRVKNIVIIRNIVVMILISICRICALLAKIGLGHFLFLQCYESPQLNIRISRISLHSDKIRLDASSGSSESDSFSHKKIKFNQKDNSEADYS